MSTTIQMTIKLKETLKDFDLKTAKEILMIQRTTERLNNNYSGKYICEMINYFICKVPLKGKDVLLNSTLLGYFNLILKNTVVLKCLNRFESILFMTSLNKESDLSQVDFDNH